MNDDDSQIKSLLGAALGLVMPLVRLLWNLLF